ncbi:Molybdenum transport system permease protein ModB [Comamonas sp. PE63]|uniref:Molybdenum transport system permease n=1 Tax=Comamonas brasiliensis TaxID=1812482 RepID=A0ABS5LYU8_9BURK|nr:molybdate ABC transporter permease subunit [Comamonas sp. PE63]MBS3021685.1 Molybdenum transport system permease protein ModB [Comamonas sp. PE63]
MLPETCAWTSFPLTLKVMGWSVLLQLALGVPLAWVLARCSFRGKALLDALVTLPLVFPPIVIGYVLLLLLGREGWLLTWLPQDWRPHWVFSETGLVIAAVVAGLPLMVKPAQAAFAEMDDSLREVAATLGARPWQVIIKVELPLARLGILAGLVLAAGRSMGEVGISLMLGGNISGRTETLSLAVYNHVLGSEADCANALSLVLAGLAALAFFLLRKFERPMAKTG